MCDFCPLSPSTFHVPGCQNSRETIGGLKASWVVVMVSLVPSTPGTISSRTFYWPPSAPTMICTYWYNRRNLAVVACQHSLRPPNFWPICGKYPQEQACFSLEFLEQSILIFFLRLLKTKTFLPSLLCLQPTGFNWYFRYFAPFCCIFKTHRFLHQCCVLTNGGSVCFCFIHIIFLTMSMVLDIWGGC